MPNSRQVAISATDPLGLDMVAYQRTMDAHRLKHPEPFTDVDVVEGYEDPDMIALSGHEIPSHRMRYVYYRKKDWEDEGPEMMKLVVDHGSKPGVLVSAFRTSKYTQDGAIVHIREGYFKERMR